MIFLNQQERLKHDRLVEEMNTQQTQPLPLVTFTPSKFVFASSMESFILRLTFGYNFSNVFPHPSSFQDDLLSYQKRVSENLTCQISELNHDLEKSHRLVSKLKNEVERLKGQLKSLQVKYYLCKYQLL